VEVAALQAYVQ
jgi:hypothetical protein